jgi:hypothetical protein
MLPNRYIDNFVHANCNEPMTEPKPNFQWFRYSLRTLFALVTIFCAYLASQVRIVHHRKQLLAKAAAHSSSRSTRLRSRTPYLSSKGRFNFRVSGTFHLFADSSGTVQCRSSVCHRQ